MTLEEARQRMADRTRAAGGLAGGAKLNSPDVVRATDLRLLLAGLDVDGDEVCGALHRGALNVALLAISSGEPVEALHGMLVQVFAMGYLMGEDAGRSS